MTDVVQIRDGLVTTLKLLKGAPWQTNIPDANFRTYIDTQFSNDKRDSSFPKCMVVLEGGDSVPGVGGDGEDTANFMVVFVTKATSPTDVPQARAERFVVELEELLYSNPDLNGTVTLAKLTGFELDGGTLLPEAACVARIETQRRRFN